MVTFGIFRANRSDMEFAKPDKAKNKIHRAKNFAALEIEINGRYDKISKLERRMPRNSYAPVALQAIRIGHLIQTLSARLPPKTFPTWCEYSFKGGRTNAMSYRLLAKHWRLIRGEINKTTTLFEALIILMAKNLKRLESVKTGPRLLADSKEIVAVSGKVMRAERDRLVAIEISDRRMKRNGKRKLRHKNKS